MKTIAKHVVMAALAVSFAGCCTLNQPDDPCRGNEATVSIGPGQLHIRPECLEVRPGDRITMNLKRANGVGVVRTEVADEDAGATWLNATSAEGDTLTLSVPEDAAPGSAGPCGLSVCEYKYEIIVPGIGRLDPRVRVIHRSP